MEQNTENKQIEQTEEKKGLNFIYFLLVCLLGFVIIGESVMIIRLLYQKPIVTKTTVTTGEKPTPSLVQKIKGEMAIQMVAGSDVVVGKSLKATISFNSYDTIVAGVDTIINFDPQLISIKTITQNGKLFANFTVNKQQEKQGRILITAVAPVNQLKGSVELATINFTLLKGSPTTIALEYKGTGVTTDSNLVSVTDNSDILERVTSLTLEPNLSR